jgi:hypothetical protein
MRPKTGVAFTAVFWTWLVIAAALCGSTRAAEEIPKVTAPPESFFEMVNQRDREAAKKFYTKYLDVTGIPVAASGEIADEALRRTRWIVMHLLAGRPDVVEGMKKNRMYLIVIGKDQLYCDMPEYSHAQNAAYLNERVRGTGGRPTSFGEENVLSLPLDRYDDESIAVHEFCHTIDGALRGIDPTWTERRNKVYRNAIDKGLWKNTYGGSNPGEFWAEICQSYFDCNRVNNWNHGPIGTREQLKEYDPESYELVRTTFNLTPDQDWRYTWAQKLPNVTAPPAKFKIDPYYTKFTWAREFTVIGREASDEALLKANDTIRKMFAYRHDILKALIADGWRLAVVKDGEKIPQDAKMLTVQEGQIADVLVVMARTFYEVTSARAVDPNWDNRRDVQQYELRVQRLDERWGEKVKEAYYGTKDKSLWSPAASASQLGDWFAQGAAAYFGVAGSKEHLQKYYPKKFALINETMAYEGHPDWRFQP